MPDNNNPVKIAITSAGNTTDSMVNEQFGRAPYFILLDADKMQFEAAANPGEQANSGAGIKAAGFLINAGVKILLTGQVGDKAAAALKEGGVTVLEGFKSSLKVKDAVNNYFINRSIKNEQ